MTSFDRLAWRCSAIARVAFVSLCGALLLEATAGALGALPGPARVFVRAAIVLLLLVGVAAHMVVQRHAVKQGSFPPGTDRSALELSVRLSPWYGKWRKLMRAQHPELRLLKRARRSGLGEADRTRE